MLLRTVTRPHVILALVAVVLMTITSVFVGGVSLAQSGETINYGATVVGNISTAAPLAVYNFNASAGDLITVRVVGLTSEMDPSVILLGPAQEQLASSDNDQFSFGEGDARISFFTANGGSYSLIVGGAGGTTGDFVLRLEGRTPVSSTEIEFNVPVRVDVPINSAPQFFTF
ncbi:MAG: hypothetical protein H7175_25675, partial [Burkholderiales bacterium]|nr:hypothetical protein [Anaerolineae bacterium]